jgi:hypothetical protein
MQRRHSQLCVRSGRGCACALHACHSAQLACMCLACCSAAATASLESKPSPALSTTPSTPCRSPCAAACGAVGVHALSAHAHAQPMAAARVHACCHHMGGGGRGAGCDTAGAPAPCVAVRRCRLAPRGHGARPPAAAARRSPCVGPSTLCAAQHAVQQEGGRWHWRWHAGLAHTSAHTSGARGNTHAGQRPSRPPCAACCGPSSLEMVSAVGLTCEGHV